ncbi:MAG TPA: DUF192 domain-containing protein [Thermoanaerobaculia bacterium]|nr:DUF192 domain-containing protein [Thermoanaerobaculia bacterium]
MGRKDLARSFLWIPRCRSVHTWFMRGPIDIVFLDRQKTVVSAYAFVRPWQFCLAGREADSVLELPAGWLEAEGILRGDRILWPSD